MLGRALIADMTWGTGAHVGRRGAQVRPGDATNRRDATSRGTP